MITGSMFADNLLSSVRQSVRSAKSTRSVTSSFINKKYRPRRPPVWVPDHLAFNCKQCDVEFVTLLNPVHHCRNCGRCFCDECSNFKALIPEFGYFEPTRVCRECKDDIELADLMRDKEL